MLSAPANGLDREAGVACLDSCGKLSGLGIHLEKVVPKTGAGNALPEKRGGPDRQTPGHGGDAGALRTCCRRPADLAARHGGEEFA